MNELQFWEIGEPLSSAAINFGDAYQVGKWKTASDLGSMESLALLLFADLFARIEEGGLAAFGFQTEPSVSDGPVRIPAHTFDPRPQLNLARCDKLQVSAYFYERIRVLPERHLGSSSSHEPNRKSSMGRRSTYAKSKAVLATLFEIASNLSKSAEKLHPDFELEFRRQFPMDEWGVPPPSERTLREHLKRYRQELEETPED